ncbi:hypothetical protein [Evansella halocellulosilytica]|nr:hypothetical protein [Evansella halocellulosilytica]
MKGKSNTWLKQCLEQCESVGISKPVMNMFIHQHGRKNEQNHKEIKNTRS